VKKARDLLLLLRRVARLTYGNGVFEKLLLDGSRQIIPLQEHGALASGLLAFRRFGCLAIMHPIWDAEEPAATGNGAPCRPLQSDVAGGR
jgi:hypothetical protein